MLLTELHDARERYLKEGIPPIGESREFDALENYLPFLASDAPV
jgi:hypothetical protein